jgi:cobalamin biosynthesis protein CobD/CbiB
MIINVDNIVFTFCAYALHFHARTVNAVPHPVYFYQKIVLICSPYLSTLILDDNCP